MTSAEKSRFRATKRWKDFRKQVIAERGPYCQVCGGKRKSLHLHHCREADYLNLDADHFRLLCSACHRYWERKARQKQSKELIAYRAILNFLFD